MARVDSVCVCMCMCVDLDLCVRVTMITGVAMHGWEAGQEKKKAVASVFAATRTTRVHCSN